MSDVSTTSSAHRRPRWQIRLAAVVLAVVGNAVVWLIARAAGVDFEVEPPGQGVMTVALGPVIGITAVTALLAWAVLAVLERFTRRGYAVWLVIAAVVFALFLVPPLTSQATTGTRVSLLAMHVVEAAVLVLGFRPARA